MRDSSNNLTRVMVVTNIVMAAAICALVARELFDRPGDVYASGGAAGGKYIAVPIQYAQNREVLMVIDTSSDVMIAYGVDIKGDRIYAASGRTMDQDFKMVSKMRDNYFTGVDPGNRQYYPRAIKDLIEKGEKGEKVPEQ